MGSGCGLTLSSQPSPEQSGEEEALEGFEEPPVYLNERERGLILRACMRFRGSIPIYLQSGKVDAQLLDSAIRKLS